MNTLWLDLETFSPINLTLTGPYVYAQDVELLLNSWAWNDSEVWVDESLTDDFLAAFEQADLIVAHNAEFDRTCLATMIDDIRFEQWDCTMARARRHGLPGGLGVLCDILKVPQDQAKIKISREDLLFFCKPCAPYRYGPGQVEMTRHTKDTDPVRWARFKEYGQWDVVAMREVARRLPTWNDECERRVWLADQRINARGFAVDLDYVDKAIALLKAEAGRLDDEVHEKTGLDSARQRDAFLEHVLAAHGVALPDLTAATIERRLKDENLPDGLRELLELRQESSRTSTAKYTVFRRVTCSDGRVRGAFTYCGAKRTKRWAGNKVQAHNFRRPAIGKLRGEALHAEVRNAARAVKAGVFKEWAEYPMTEVLSSSLRSAIVAPPGRMLVVADWSNVEGRKVAWLAGEKGKLAAFRAYDVGTGPDLYRKAYSDAFAKPVDAVDDFERQIGKVMELMLGFGGGVGAFVTGAATYKIELSALVETAWPVLPDDVKDETAAAWAKAVQRGRTYGLPEIVWRTCDGLKILWRRRHPAIVRYWSNPEWKGGNDDGAEEVVRRVLQTGRTEPCGPVLVEKWKTWLRVQLPSGSWLSYPGAQVKDDKNATIRYLGENPYTKQWGWVTTYGGKLVENWTQGSCRDILADVLEEHESDAVLHVHDEPVLEVPEHEADAYLTWLVGRMKVCAWAPGLPLAVKGFVTPIYYKE